MESYNIDKAGRCLSNTLQVGQLDVHAGTDLHAEATWSSAKDVDKRVEHAYTHG